MIKTRKIKLIPTGVNKEIKTAKLDYVKTIASKLSIIGNEIVRLHIQTQYDIKDLTENKKFTKTDAIKYVQEKLGTSIQNSGYRLTSKYPEIPSEIRTGLSSLVLKKIKADFYEIVKGNKSISSFTKTNMPIPFSAKKDKDTKQTKSIEIIDKKYILKFPCVDKTFEDMNFQLWFGKGNDNKKIVNRILNGDYELCDSSIKYNSKKNFFELLLTYKFDSVISEEIIPNKIMGIDIGINRPVSFYISDEKYQPYQINIGEKIQHDRMKHYKTRTNLQRTLKYTNGGHGRKAKLKALNNLSETESNWSTMMNHKISRETIDIAKEYNVGKIKMEDLTGITAKTDNYFLKTWKYYELQTFIKYKAEEAGIKVEWVNPKNTSITCPVCGNIDKENRNDEDKTKFKCSNEYCPDYNIIKDADINAAINITAAESSEVKPGSKQGRIEKAKKKKELILQ